MKLAAAVFFAAMTALSNPGCAKELTVVPAASQLLSQNVQVQGSVLYLARINPLPGSRLIITVEDASRADAPAKRIKRARFRISGVPFKFAVKVPRGAFDRQGNLSLRAEIRTPDRRLMWVSGSHVVLTVDPFSDYVDVGEVLLTRAN